MRACRLWNREDCATTSISAQLADGDAATQFDWDPFVDDQGPGDSDSKIPIRSQRSTEDDFLEENIDPRRDCFKIVGQNMAQTIKTYRRLSNAAA
jgi:hypothetical protein